MAFVTLDENKVEVNKQHINLSLYAYDVLQNDMLLFDNNKISNFINLIFEYYYSDAKASVSLVLNRYRSELNDIFSDIKVEEKIKKQIVDNLIEKKRISLTEKHNQYENGKYFKFYLNKKNFDYLTNKTSECGEEAHYAKRGQYIKSVIEEYTRLSYIDRELIYYKPRIQAISYAIENKKQLRVKTSNGKVFYVYPYKILQDPLSTTNYLVGFSYADTQSEEKKIPCSFKIAALQTVEPIKSKNGKIKADEVMLLDQKIESRGVQFMVGKETEIHVRLTAAGIQRYDRYIHLRPAVLEKQGNTYVFNCTEAQAQFYFFKFGEDAEILKPESLRKRFREMYKAAIDIYK